MAKARIALSKEWRQFVNRYGAERAYWYVPKGLAATAESLKPRLMVLKGFEGRIWRDCQRDYVERLNRQRISHAEAEWDEGGAPLARMLKQVFVMLGLAWVDRAERIEITPAGDIFLTAEDPGGILSDQLGRFQFWNPSVASKAHKSISLHPIPFLGEVLRSIPGNRISPVEFTLFIARAKRFADVDTLIEQIERFRALDEEAQRSVVTACEAYKLSGVRRTSMYNTIRLNRPYALRMFSLSRLLQTDGDGWLALRQGALKGFRGYLANYVRQGAYIEFENEKDWIAYFGDPNAAPTVDTALEYYVNTGDVAAAIATKKRTTNDPKELAEFQDMIISEKAIEEYLKDHLDVIDATIGTKLKLEGRQFSTTVGPIDLLATDRKTGDYVVIELKKGRTADKVYGQCSRYMGWVRKNLAEPRGSKVHGVIVARGIDKKLIAARDAHDTKVHLIEFAMKLSATAVQPLGR